MPNRIDCFDKINIPGLKERFDTETKDITDEEAQRAIGKKIALDYHKQLFTELETFKNSIGIKSKEKYVSPDTSPLVEKIKSEYQKKIDAAREPIIPRAEEGNNKNESAAVGKVNNGLQVDNSGSGEGVGDKKELTGKEALKKARGIEDLTDPIDMVMQHFINGGKINTTEIQKIFGSRSKNAEGEKRARIGLINSKGETIDQLAHKLWEADTTGKYTTEDYREAVEQVVSGHVSASSMAKDLVDRYINKAVRQELTNEELQYVDDVLIGEVQKLVDGIPEEQQNQLVEVLRNYQDKNGFIDWDKLEKDNEGFEPLILNLPEQTQKSLDEIIKKNNSTRQSELGNSISQDSGQEKSEGQAAIPPIEPPPPTGEDVGENPADMPEIRKFTKRMVEDEDLVDEVKGEVAKTLKYARQTNEVTLAKAEEIIEKVGLDEAQNFVSNDNDVQPAVRVAMGQVLIKKYNELSKKAPDQATKDFYLDKAIQTANYVTTQLATEGGRQVQAFALWARLSPEGQLRAANQDVAKQGKEKMRRREKDINVISDKFQKANEETVDELTKSETVKKSVNKADTNRTKKAKDKIQQAKIRRQRLIDKYKGGKGKNLFSSPTGLTPEGIEYVGNMAKTYLDEGVAKLEIVVDKIIQHLKDAAGKDPNDEVKKNVNDIVRGYVEKNQNQKIVEGLSELEKEINKIVREHYTVSEEKKKSLVDKFIESTGLDKSDAEQLSKEIETEFDKIATRKKRNILYHEKARFDKIQNTLKNGTKKAEPKTVQDDLIKYSNLGAFENEEFKDFIANKFGIGEITPEQAAKLIALAEKIQRAPEGSPKNDATEDLLAYRANLRGNDLMETAQAVWYANILSGHKTHEKNLTSTFFQSMGELSTEMAKDPKAIPYLMGGYFKGLFTRGLTEAVHTLKTGRSPIHIKKIETPGTLERKNFIGGGFNPANWFKYITRLMVAEDVISFQGLKEARAYQLARREAASQGFNTWSKKGWDKVNEVLFHTKERWSEAEAQVKEEGLSGIEARRRIYELMEDSRPQEMTEDAYGFAAHGTFNHESEGTLGAITNAVAAALDGVNMGGAKPGRFIVPFTRIITNVVNNSLDFTPIGLIRAARGVRGFKTFEGGQYTKGAYKELSREERQRLIAKAAIGIGLAATFQALHEAGILQITGGGSDDDKKNAQLREVGWQEYSIKIGDKYYSYKYTPLVFMMGFLGNMNDAHKYGGEDRETILKRMEYAAFKLGSQVTEMTWINSAGTFLGALTERKTEQQERSISKVLAGTARGFIPFSGTITQVSQEAQNIFKQPQKQVNNSWQALIQDIPIARNSLDDKINALGEPVMRDTDVITSQEKNDPVWKFILEKQGWVAPVSKNTISIFDLKTKQDRPITGDEYYEFSKIRGEKIKDDLKGLMRTGYYFSKNSLTKAEDFTPAQLNKVLTSIEAEATKETKAELFGEKVRNKKEEKDKDATKEKNDRLEKSW